MAERKDMTETFALAIGGLTRLKQYDLDPEDRELFQEALDRIDVLFEAWKHLSDEKLNAVLNPEE